MAMYRVCTRIGVSHLRRTFASETKGEITALYDFHVQNGGKIVNFGGYLLPVQYANLGISASHLHTRKNTSIFDVSHMLQTEIIGTDAIAYMETICTADLQNLPRNSSVLTVFTNTNGGILDDLIITKIAEDHLFVVSNAAMKKQDQSILLRALDVHRKNNPSTTGVQLKFFEPLERGLVALQGPGAQKALQRVTESDLATLYFMQSQEASVCGVGACRITRCGYTGEDGFEISMPAMKAPDIARELLKGEGVELAGLGARDSLRLEAGLCLYGNDIGPETTPVEAGLSWLVAKRRRAAADFPGAAPILAQLKEGASRKRVGLLAASGPPARPGCAILSEDGSPLGQVTSGCPSPSLGQNVAMGYVPSGASAPGTKLQLRIRDKLYSAIVTKMPFVKANYYNKPK